MVYLQILAIESNYLCRTFPDTDKFWASRQELASKLTPDYPQLRVMRRQGEKGLASAVVRGWQGFGRLR